MSKPWLIHQGDVRAVLKSLESGSFDACLSDPPYGLSFMGRRWDYHLPSVNVWVELLRVLKPGAHAMLFGGSRTFHRLSCGVEDAGFELRDLCLWLYSSGFPKSLDVSKAIDKQLGAKRRVTGKASALWENWERNSGGKGRKRSGKRYDEPVTKEAALWNGWGTTLKPAFEPIVLARKMTEGNVAMNALRYGTGGINIAATRIGTELRTNTGACKTGMWAMKREEDEIGVRDVVGRFPSNIAFSHHDECKLVGTRKAKDKVFRTESNGRVVSKNRAMGGPNYGRTVVEVGERPDEEVWECVRACPISQLEEQAGVPPGSLRFFFTAKASARERDAGCDDLEEQHAGVLSGRNDQSLGGTEVRRKNIHPTVKPLALIRYYATLLLPPARATPRRIVVPFSGSGSEIIACLQAGWDEVVGIEREAEYIKIANARIRKGGVFSKLLPHKKRR